MYDQEGGLQAVREGNPGQVPEDQHEAKAIVHNVHGGQNSFLLWDEIKSAHKKTPTIVDEQVAGRKISGPP